MSKHLMLESFFLLQDSRQRSPALQSSVSWSKERDFKSHLCIELKNPLQCKHWTLFVWSRIWHFPSDSFRLSYFSRRNPIKLKLKEINAKQKFYRDDLFYETGVLVVLFRSTQKITAQHSICSTHLVWMQNTLQNVASSWLFSKYFK